MTGRRWGSERCRYLGKRLSILQFDTCTSICVSAYHSSFFLYYTNTDRSWVDAHPAVISGYLWGIGWGWSGVAEWNAFSFHSILVGTILFIFKIIIYCFYSLNLKNELLYPHLSPKRWPTESSPFFDLRSERGPWCSYAWCQDRAKSPKSA